MNKQIILNQKEGVKNNINYAIKLILESQLQEISILINLIYSASENLYKTCKHNNKESFRDVMLKIAKYTNPKTEWGDLKFENIWNFSKHSTLTESITIDPKEIFDVLLSTIIDYKSLLSEQTPKMLDYELIYCLANASFCDNLEHQKIKAELPSEMIPTLNYMTSIYQ